jgi:phenylacetate-CoA ligase
VASANDELRQLLQRLGDSQWRPEAERLAWQLEAGTALLRHAVAQVPYYASLRDALPAEGAPLTWAQWRQLPLITRVDIQRHADELIAREIPPQHLPLDQVLTSGSTGSPLRAMTTGVTRLMWAALTLRDHLWHQRDFKGRLGAIRFVKKGEAPYPHGDTAPTWGPPASLVFDTGGSALLSVRTDVEQQLEWLHRVAPTYLIMYPSNALALGELMTARRAALPALRQLRLFGETVDEAEMDALRQHFGAPVCDMYSSNEVGYIALQCGEFGHYHVQAESVLVEVLDEGGAPCAPGQIGRVVITTLHNLGMPLIRYQIGDYAEVGPPCACGRGMPVLNRILGRTRNMLTLPNGQRHWPTFGISDIRKVAPIVQCQILQHTVERLEARLIVERPLTEDEVQQVRAAILRGAGYPFQIDFSYHDRIERSATWKFEEFKSLLA